ncbi:hypothetical protein FB567DRAFT_546397 [Paraphoma chrysanthemicola]|uniref:Uncharacterized protein n=1 Tax=Paraphoma chrysanthemicola TaxID=798071 RepID=A0A8K0W0V8_9PLEO|nr:hypothetical protein FB567DRAFT_546397 [Paraphoma chrysanthemicola]
MEDLADWYDGIAYCTWNGIRRELNEEKILETLGELTDQGIRVANLNINENCQSLNTKVHLSRSSTDAPAMRQTRRLFCKACDINYNVREAQLGLRHTAVWHGIFGYWGETSPDAHIAKCCTTGMTDR